MDTVALRQRAARDARAVSRKGRLSIDFELLYTTARAGTRKGSIGRACFDRFPSLHPSGVAFRRGGRPGPVSATAQTAEMANGAMSRESRSALLTP